MSDVTLYLGDCLEVMRGLPDGSVDAVVTDPPYGEHQAEWDDSKPDAFIFNEFYRLLKFGGVLYYWGFWGHADWILPHAKVAGFTPQTQITWWFRTGRPEKKSYREDKEIAWYFSKGEPTIFNSDDYLEPYEDESNYKRYGRNGKHPGTVWLASRIFHNHPENVGHPTQKPLQIIDKMVGISTLPGDTILDPFMGSGTTGVACVQTGRKFIGIEIDPDYYAIAEKRIAEAQMQIRMPVW